MTGTGTLLGHGLRLHSRAKLHYSGDKGVELYPPLDWSYPPTMSGCCFSRGAFTEAEFLKYLDFKDQDLPPEPQACKDIKGKQDFSNVASAVAKAIKDRREHYLFLCLAFLTDI